MPSEKWHDVGAADDLPSRPVTQVRAGSTLIALVSKDGVPSAISGACYRMAERMNSIQNQVTTHDRVLIRDKVAGFIVVGGQDNVQAVAGQLLGFFAELGFLFPQFPYVAHSRGWTAEDMERNCDVLRTSRELREGAEALVDRGGRKAHALAPPE